MLKLIRSVLVVSFLSIVSPLAAFAAQVVDINTADVSTMAENINGIGESKAQAIVDYRTKNGLFTSVDELVNVKGIGIKTVDRIREFLVVTPAGGTAKSSPAKVKAAKPVLAKQPATQPALPAN